jgi:non-heme chloroperoxidase
MKNYFLSISIAITLCTSIIANPCKIDFNSLPSINLETLPPLQKFIARDNQSLSYRLYGSSKNNLIIMLHGLAYHGSYLDPLAKKLSINATVCIPNIRGHYQSGLKKGSCSYIGQLEDDIADLMQHLDYTSFTTTTMLGHSSGGGLAIRFAGSTYGALIKKYILLAPVIPLCKNLLKPDTNWASVSNLKIGLLTIANMFGCTWFNNSSVITFNMPPQWRDGTETLVYDYNLFTSMHPRYSQEEDIAALDRKSIIIIGRNDECVNGEIYKKLFKQSSVHILESANHFSVISNNKTYTKITDYFSQKLPPVPCNITDAFISFWEQAKDLPLEEQIIAFDQLVYPKFPEFYEFSYKSWHEDGLNKSDKLKKVFNLYAPIHETFKQRSTTITTDFTTHLTSFIKRFPDFFTDYPIYLLHSLDQMDGGAREINSNVYFMFGLDRIINCNTHDANLAPFFHHELFHMYHLQFFPNFTCLFWEYLWFEGLATYVSQLMNPDASLAELSLNDPLVPQCTKKLRFLWDQIAANLDVKNDNATYVKYFLLTSTDTEVPIRAGYYLGYLIAQELAQQFSIDELVKMKKEKIRTLIGDTVQRQIKKNKNP